MFRSLGCPQVWHPCMRFAKVAIDTTILTGAHSVHQLLHHASRLPDGEKAPFQTAILESNAIVSVSSVFSCV